MQCRVEGLVFPDMVCLQSGVVGVSTARVEAELFAPRATPREVFNLHRAFRSRFQPAVECHANVEVSDDTRFAKPPAVSVRSESLEGQF